MNHDPYADPFIPDAASMSQADAHLIACVWVGGLVILSLAVIARVFTKTALQRRTITASVARRRLIFTNGFGTFAALAAPFPMAFAARGNGIGSVLIWELTGAAITLFAVGLAAAFAQSAAHGADRCETSNDDDCRRSRGINPATGYPMIGRSIDAAGHAYGCGPDYSEDRHWDR